MFKMVGPPVPLTELNAVTKTSGMRLYEVSEGRWSYVLVLYPSPQITPPVPLTELNAVTRRL